MQLTASIFVETEFRGSTVSYLVTSEGVVLIDSPYLPTDAVAWRKEIAARGQVRYLINTEAHNDHIAGNFFFRAPLITSENTRHKFLAIDATQFAATLLAMDPAGAAYLQDYRLTLPAITYENRMTLYLGDHALQLLNLPGHTPGQTVVYIPSEKVLFTGDNVTGKIQSLFQEADPFAWLSSLKQMELLEIQYIVPGHGEICPKSYLKEQSDYIEESLATVSSAVQQGWSKQETLARLTLPHRYPLEKGQEVIGPKLIQMSVAHLYDILAKNRS